MIPDLNSGEMVVPETVHTMRDLLIHIGGKTNYSFFVSESGQLEDDFEILLNGKEIWFYAKGLDAPLKNGDLVEIYPLLLGGG